MNVRRTDGDESWLRLKEWLKGQKSAERLALQLLNGEDYKALDPSHPLGGPDGGKDLIAQREGKKFIVAVYFPRGQQSFSSIQSKFKEDLEGVKRNTADGMAFLTNQELTIGEREDLKKLGPDNSVDIFHLERISSLINTPSHYGTRLEFLDIEMTKEDQLAFFSDLQQKSKLMQDTLHSILASLGDHQTIDPERLESLRQNLDQLSDQIINTDSYLIPSLNANLQYPAEQIRQVKADLEAIVGTDPFSSTSFVMGEALIDSLNSKLVGVNDNIQQISQSIGALQFLPELGLLEEKLRTILEQIEQVKQSQL